MLGGDLLGVVRARNLAKATLRNIKENLFADPELEAARRFMLETARFYYANREFLFDGQMLSPSGFTCPAAPVDFLIRSIFTKERECKPRH